MNSKFYIFLLLFLVPQFVFANEVNQQSLFGVEIESYEKEVFNDNIDTTFTFLVQNNEDFDQEIVLDISEVSGWDIIVDEKDFILTVGESKTVDIRFKANSDFDYTPRIVGDDLIKIKVNEGYSGYQDFPVKISSGESEISLTFQVEILAKEDVEATYIPKISSRTISPVSDLGFSVEAQDLYESQFVLIELFLENEKIYSEKQEFDFSNAYQVFQVPISSNYDPGRYDVEVVVRLEKELENNQNTGRDWSTTSEVIVSEYKFLAIEDEYHKNLIKDEAYLTVLNMGNVADSFEYEFDHSFFTSLFFGITANDNSLEYSENEGVISFTVDLEKGESVEINYYYNFVPLYVILFVLAILLMYIYVRKTSNPLDVETRVYEVKKVAHEGVKSMKVRIGFENIKSDEIESLKMIFRMPNYLNVKDDSFLLTPPKQVLKGATHYKLVWEFKRFEKDESRILGFMLVNKKGILGDVRLEDLEFEAKINGRVRKYYSTFPIVKG